MHRFSRKEKKQLSKNESDKHRSWWCWQAAIENKVFVYLLRTFIFENWLAQKDFKPRRALKNVIHVDITHLLIHIHNKLSDLLSILVCLFICISTYINTKMCVCVTVCVFAFFLGHLESDWDILWYKVALCFRNGSKQ